MVTEIPIIVEVFNPTITESSLFILENYFLEPLAILREGIHRPDIRFGSVRFGNSAIFRWFGSV